MKSRTGEALKALKQEKESRADNREAYNDQVVGLRKNDDKSLQQTLKNVYGAFD